MGRFRAQGAKRETRATPARTVRPERAAHRARRARTVRRGRMAQRSRRLFLQPVFSAGRTTAGSRTRPASASEARRGHPGRMGLPGRQVRTVRRDRTARPLRPMFPQPVFSAGRTTAENRTRPASASKARRAQQAKTRSRFMWPARCRGRMCTTRMLHMISHSLRSLPPIRQGGHAVQF